MTEPESLRAALLSLAEQGLDKRPRFVLAASLLNRAVAQRPGVAELLLDRARQHIAVLECQPKAADLPRAVEPAVKTGGAGLVELINELNVHPGSPESEYGSDLSLSMKTQEQAVFGSEAQASLDAPQQAQAPQLKAIQYLRSRQAWQRHQQQIKAALASQPENPGPLNPQMLAIKSLSHMRDLSPHYLDRFISYIETLAVLDMAAAGSNVKPNKKAPKPRKKR